MDYGDGGEEGWNGDNIITEEIEFLGGREPNWGVDGYFLTDDSPAINAGSDDSGAFGVDSLTTQYNFTPDIDAADCGYHYYLFDFEIYGVVEGELKAASDTSIGVPDALVTIHHSAAGDMSVLSFVDGFYRFPNVYIGEFWIEVQADGYLDSAEFDFELEEAETITINFDLLHPEFSASIEEVDELIAENTTKNIDFEINNEGDGTLEWSVEPRPPAEAWVLPWSLRGQLPAGDIVDDRKLEGIVFIDSLYFIAGQNDSRDSTKMIYVVDTEGELVRRFPQPGQHAVREYMRDITYDGELMWGLSGDSVFAFDAFGNVEDKFLHSIGGTPQTLCWDSENDLFWMSKVSGDIWGYDLDGAVQVTLEAADDIRKYGFSYWPDDPDGYNLYIVEEDIIDVDAGTYKFAIYKIDVINDEYEFVVEFVLRDVRPRGTFITKDFDLQNWVMMVVMNSQSEFNPDGVEIWQVSGNTSWMRPSPLLGELPPNGSSDITLTLDSGGLPFDVFKGEIVFLHNALGLETHILISMDVDESVPWDNNGAVPSNFRFTGIYPNPFNAEAMIMYELPSADHVTLRVFDLHGREVASILENQYVNAGSYYETVSFEALPSGLYFAHLEASGRTRIAKMILLK